MSEAQFSRIFLLEGERSQFWTMGKRERNSFSEIRKTDKSRNWINEIRALETEAPRGKFKLLSNEFGPFFLQSRPVLRAGQTSQFIV